MQKSSNLKPCPFCGGAAWKTVWRNADLKPMCKISCPNEECSIQPFTDYYTDEDAAVNAWNRRANDADRKDC